MGKNNKKENQKIEEKTLNKAVQYVLYSTFIHNLKTSKIEDKHFDLMKEYVSYIISNKAVAELYFLSKDEGNLASQILHMINDLIDIAYFIDKDSNLPIHTIGSNANIKSIISKRQKYYEDNNIDIEVLTQINYYSYIILNEEWFYIDFLYSLNEDERNMYHKEMSAVLEEMDTIIREYNTLFFLNKIVLKNRTIEGIVVDKDNSWRINYGLKPLFLNEDLKLTKNFAVFVQWIVEKRGFDNYMQEIFQLQNNIFSAIKRRAYNDSVPDDFKLTDNMDEVELSKDIKEFTLPFAHTDLSSFTSNTYLDYEKSLKIKNERKYCIPVEGAVIEFLNKSKMVDNVSIIEASEFICFNVKFLNNNIFNINNYNANHVFLLDKRKIDLYFYDIEKNKFNDVGSTFIESFESIPLSANTIGFISETGNEQRYIKSTIKSFLMTCLYILYVDMNIEGVKIYHQRINRETGKPYIDREITYRTAHIRKLPTGYNASEEALEEAKRQGIILPRGYTFVREFVASGEIAKRVIKVRE